MNVLAGAHDAAVQMIDTSIVRVHQHGACITRNRRQSMGRSRGGLTSKIHRLLRAALVCRGTGRVFCRPRPQRTVSHDVLLLPGQRFHLGAQGFKILKRRRRRFIYYQVCETSRCDSGHGKGRRGRGSLTWDLYNGARRDRRDMRDLASLHG
jgi:hypothetical protein